MRLSFVSSLSNIGSFIWDSITSQITFKELNKDFENESTDSME